MEQAQKEGQQILRVSKRMTNPSPANLKITQAKLSVGFNFMPQTQSDDGCSHANEAKRSCRQNQAETSKWIGQILHDSN